MSKIFIYGDSHTRALKLAAANQTIVDTGIEFDVHWMRSEKDGIIRGDMKIEDAKSLAATLRDSDLLVISLLGTAHNIFGLIAHECRFHIQDIQSIQEIQTEGMLIPVNAMRDMFYSHYSRNKKIHELKCKSSAPVYHLMTPPPKQDNEYIKSKTARYRDRSIIAESDINAPGLRLALWRLEMSVLQQFCDELGVGLIPPPSAALSEQGFLAQEYYGRDATHANIEYGGLVLNQLIGLVTK